MTERPKIYAFVNSGLVTEWLEVMAMAEDGHVLAEHISSNEYWAQKDIGLTSRKKHDNYNRHYPAGWALEWVADPKKHAGLMAAYAKNQKLRAEASDD